MRKVSLFLISILLLAVLPGGAQGAETPDEHWTLPKPIIDGQIGTGFDDREAFLLIGSLRALVYKQGVPTGPICTSVNDPKCAGADYFSFGALIEPCTSPTQDNCVEEVIARFPDGKKEKGEFKGFVTNDETYFWKGDPTKGLPDSKAESIWNFPTISHAGGKDFMLSAVLGGSYNPKNTPRFRDLVALFQPVTKIADSSLTRLKGFGNEDMTWMSPEAIAAEGSWAGAQSANANTNCATITDGFCFRREPFPGDIFFSVSLRTRTQVSGWIHGRMKGPEVSISKVGNYWRTIVGGMPTEVPVVGRWFQKSEFTDELKSAFRTAGETTMGVRSGGTATWYGTTGQFDSVTINRLNQVRPFINDRASANPHIWAFRSLDSNKLAYDVRALGGRSYCILNDSGLTGLVMTNSTQYDGSIPAFNQADQTLNYLVSAPHYAADGKEFLGTYDLVMRADIARCIYGFDKTPTSATVSIVRGDSVEKVSTTTLSEKDGWISLAAYGFTFSTPKISVKLIAPTVAPAASPVVAPSIKPAPAKVATQKSIVCAQGKSKKKLTGTNPKCPKGYKLVK